MLTLDIVNYSHPPTPTSDTDPEAECVGESGLYFPESLSILLTQYLVLNCDKRCLEGIHFWYKYKVT